MVVCTVHTTQQNSLIGQFPQIKFFYWSRQCHQYLGPYVISPIQIFTMHAPHTHIYICHTSHILWKNLQAYIIEGTVRQETEHKIQGASRALGIVRQLNEFHIIHSQNITTYTSHNIFSGIQLTSSKMNQ